MVNGEFTYEHGMNLVVHGCALMRMKNARESSLIFRSSVEIFEEYSKYRPHDDKCTEKMSTSRNNFLVYISIMVTTYHSGHYLHNITIIEQRNQFIKLFGYKACLQRHFQDRKTLSSGKKTCQDESGEI